MKFEVLTIFPDFFHGPFDFGIVRRAKEAGLVEINIHDLRVFTKDRHRTVDDRPFGGGELAPIRITSYVDAPAGSGLGSSSALVVALVEAFTREYLMKLLDCTNGNQVQAARIAGLDRSYLGRMVSKLGLSRFGRARQ